MGSEGFGRRIVSSAVFRRLKDRAIEYARNPDQLTDLVRRASRRAESAGRNGPITGVWDSLAAFFRLLRAYARREYTDIPPQRIVLIVAAVLYFVSPIDVIPDFVVGLGFIDDAAVIAWVFSTVKGVLDDFLRWEVSRSGDGRGDIDPVV